MPDERSHRLPVGWVFKYHSELSGELKRYGPIDAYELISGHLNIDNMRGPEYKRVAAATSS